MERQPAKWRSAFATQANADLDTYELLWRTTQPTSQRLHFLQMWLEKLSESYVYATESRLRK